VQLEGGTELAQGGQVEGIDVATPLLVPRQVQGIAEIHHREASLPQHFLLRLAFRLLGSLASFLRRLLGLLTSFLRLFLGQAFFLRLVLGGLTRLLGLLLGAAFLLRLALGFFGLLPGGFLGLLGLLLGAALLLCLRLRFFLRLAFLLRLRLRVLVSFLGLFLGATLPLGLRLRFFLRLAFFLRLRLDFLQLRPPSLRLFVGEDPRLPLLIPRHRELIPYRPEPSPQRLAVDRAFSDVNPLQRSPPVFPVQLQHVRLRRGAPPFQREFIEQQQLLHPKLRVLLR
jgi:hypothetical protein